MSASSAPSFATSSRRASRTPWVVLGLLAYEPMTGYDLKAAIQATVGHFWQESYGQLYPTLHALRDDGLVTMTREAVGGRTRNVCAITDEGRAAVLAWRGSVDLQVVVTLSIAAVPLAVAIHLPVLAVGVVARRQLAARTATASDAARDHSRT